MFGSGRTTAFVRVLRHVFDFCACFVSRGERGFHVFLVSSPLWCASGIFFKSCNDVSLFNTPRATSLGVEDLTTCCFHDLSRGLTGLVIGQRVRQANA